jgi:predicted RNA-binding Zn-ribbon protein involved in translation (DUF1610 family)
MVDFITLSCPSCGYKHQITKDIDQFACVACGNEHIINPPLMVSRVKEGSDKKV